MNEQEVINELRRHKVTKNSRSMLEYERAKRLLFKGPMSAEEYSSKIKIITDYINI